HRLVEKRPGCHLYQDHYHWRLSGVKRKAGVVALDSGPEGLRPLQLDVLQRPRVGEAPDQVDAWLLHARADAPDEGQLVDRDVGHPIAEDLLDLVEQRLALPHVQLP